MSAVGRSSCTTSQQRINSSSSVTGISQLRPQANPYRERERARKLTFRSRALNLRPYGLRDRARK